MTRIMFALLLFAQMPSLLAGNIDSTAQLQSSIDRLPNYGVFDCSGHEYQVTTLRLKSNMTLANCTLSELPGSTDLAAPITIDGRVHEQTHISIRNVHVNGNRHGQTHIGYSGEENGGRHCFRLLGRVSNVAIEHSSGTYCAGDGIALVSYGVGTSDRADALPFRNIVIRNSDFSFNRRHGSSADGISGLTFDHVTFTQNGTTLPGNKEGDRCDLLGGSCYGTGFWYEDYKTDAAGEGLNGLSFIGCTFRKNYRRSLFFLTREHPTAVGFAGRANIRIVDSILDAGSQPLAEDYAVQFQVDEGMPVGSVIYKDIAIGNATVAGTLGFHDVAGVSIVSSTIRTKLPLFGYFAYSTDIAFRNVEPASKRLAGSFDPTGGERPAITYSKIPMPQ